MTSTLTRRISSLSLTSKFYMSAALLLAFTAASFSWASTQYVTNKTFGGAIERAEVHAAELQATYRTGLTGRKWRKLVREWRHHGVLVTKVWSPDGRILRASDHRLDGRRFPPTEELKRAVATDKAAYELSPLDAAENRFERGKYRALIEVYVPIRVGNRVVAVHEIYFSAVPLNAEIASVTRTIWLANLAAFGLLFLILSGIVRTASRQMRLQQQSLRDTVTQLSAHYMATIESLNMALQSRDHYTARHSERVAELAVAIGRAAGVSREELDALKIGSLFHDIGKIGINDELLLKQDCLTAVEFDDIRDHPIIGYEILRPLSPIAAGLAVVRHHHECWDGSGYPDGLHGEQIELVARISAYADVYDSLTSERPYRPSMTPEQALDTMESLVGSHLDPTLAPVALDVLADLAGDGLATGLAAVKRFSRIKHRQADVLGFERSAGTRS